jgi:23S rRNA pseudouridine955/2504/2580 synthase
MEAFVMTEARHIKITEDEEGMRLDRWLKKQIGPGPQSLVFKLIRTGQVRVDGKRAKAEQRLEADQEVRLPPLESQADKEQKARRISEADKEFIKSLILYDDGDLMALNKPGDIATQGGTKTFRHIDGLLEAFKDRKGNRPHLVHRLDKETSGVLLVARSAKAVRELGFMFKNNQIRKIYGALVAPAPEIREGTIKAPLLKAGGKNKERMVINEEQGQRAITDYQMVDQLGSAAAFVAFLPKTGRTHQIRVHAADVLNTPLVGDYKYGFNPEGLEDQIKARRLHLHAWQLSFMHPFTGKEISIQAPLAPDLAKTWKAFGFSEKLDLLELET